MTVTDCVPVRALLQRADVRLGDLRRLHQLPVLERITITGSNKSGLGLVSMDGAKISDVHYSDITMTGVAVADHA